jgi:hypothetical protein
MKAYNVKVCSITQSTLLEHALLHIERRYLRAASRKYKNTKTNNRYMFMANEARELIAQIRISEDEILQAARG